MIRKSPNKNEWCVYSDTKKNKDGTSKGFGCYPSKSQAEKRLSQVEYFKHTGSINIFANIQVSDDTEYLAFIAYVDNNIITAGFMDSIKEKTMFITDFAKSIGKSFSDIIKYFKDKNVFTFFSQFGWSIKNIADHIKEAIHFMDKLLTIVAKHINENDRVKRMTEVSDKIIKEIDNFLHKHPMLKHIGGALLASILLYVAINGVYAGSVADFDMSDVVLAFLGKLTFFDVFQGEQGIKILISLALGFTPLSLSYGVWSNIPKAGVTIFNFIKKVS